ncbi:FAD-binding protein [Pollutimonas sp. H1-120]|uniref:FAD-binding protein n=1 Tax=Pollutimonas sp. H1-120 TaxID=3148824 RepID=UPI003B52BDBB
MSLVQELNSLGLETEELHTDVVIVGGGGAASRAALSARLAGANVLLLAKAPLGVGGSTVHGASEIMSMGASGYGSKNDSPEIHYRDTMSAAAGFIDPNLVRVLAEDAPARIKDLIDYGVAFDKAGYGAIHGAQPGEERDYKLIRSDFGSYARAMGVSGKTGKAFVTALAEQALMRGVVVRTPAALIDLLFDTQGHAAGVLAFDSEKNRWLVVHARSVVLGTGGAHGLFSQQVSTSEMTGDGQAACWRAGAELVNMEFHQFGPALIYPYIQLFSKACFVLHPKMTNALGDEFLAGYLPSGTSINEVHDEKVFPFTVSNASRWIDISIAREIAEGRGTARGGVHFSFSHVDTERLEKTMPNTSRWMNERGLDPQNDLLDVGIAFQCLNGGVRMMDADARTSLAGVHVIGELAGGIRGPDRPGGNSLAEGQVFGHRAGSAAARDALESGPPRVPVADGIADRLHRALKKNAGFDAEHAVRDLQTAMQRHALVEKNESGLQKTLDLAERIEHTLSIGGNASTNQLQQVLTLDNMATTAQIILRACLERRETRSGHYRTDYPERDDTKFGHALSLKRLDNTFTFSAIAYPAHT